MISERKNILAVCILVCCFFLLISLACSSSTPTPVSAPAEATEANTEAELSVDEATIPAVTETSEPMPTEPPAPTPTQIMETYLGDAVGNTNYSLTALFVIDPATPGMFFTPTTGEKLVGVEVIVGNLNGDPLSVNPLYATLLDQDGYIYELELGAVDDQLSTLYLDKGEKVRGVLGFSIPENAVPAKIKYSTDLFGGEELVASLKVAPADHTPIVESTSAQSNESLPALGSVIEKDGYSISASSVMDPASPGMFYEPKNGYKLVAVEITIGNVSGDPLSVNPLYAYLRDSDGFVYELELGAVDNQINSLELKAGEKVKGYVGFSIPEEATPAAIKYQLDLFTYNFLETGLSQ